MPGPVATWAALEAKRRWGDTDVVGKVALFVVILIVLWYLVMTVFAGALVGSFGDRSSPEYAASGLAVADIPPEYLDYYMQAAEEQEIDWAYLAAIGKVETNHGRSTLAGVRSGTNEYGCCAGPMQFCVIDGCPGSGARPMSVAQAQAGTWKAYATDGNDDGQMDPWDPADAIPAAAKMLRASGAPDDYHRAIFAYNHAGWYVAQVQAQAAEYRGALEEGAVLTGDVRQKLVRLAEATMTSKTGYSRYSQSGPTTDDPTPPPPARTDCSQWTRAIYLAAGLPDPGVNTTAQIAKGTRTNRPKAGDLMFTASGDHVEMYIGGGRTIGHGSPPIDHGNVDYWRGHYFMTYIG